MSAICTKIVPEIQHFIMIFVQIDDANSERNRPYVLLKAWKSKNIFIDKMKSVVV